MFIQCLEKIKLFNDAPHGTEKAYNALRMAMTLQKEHQDVEIKIFLLVDAVFCALPIQKTTSGYYNIKRMLQSIINKGGEVKSCGRCSEARDFVARKIINTWKKF